tara:strand:+ start:1187 stop:1597 length:411 start_codon:yes stop_codon:yes gene_type:complete
MTTKNVTVVVPDKTVTVDGTTFVIDPWDFKDSAIWAIQWDATTKTGDIEPAPVNGKIPNGDHEKITESNYDAKVGAYVTAWDTAKAANDVAIAAELKKIDEDLAAQKALRAEAAKLGKVPVQNGLADLNTDYKDYH